MKFQDLDINDTFSVEEGTLFKKISDTEFSIFFPNGWDGPFSSFNCREVCKHYGFRERFVIERGHPEEEDLKFYVIQMQKDYLQNLTNQLKRSFQAWPVCSCGETKTLIYEHNQKYEWGELKCLTCKS